MAWRQRLALLEEFIVLRLRLMHAIAFVTVAAALAAGYVWGSSAQVVTEPLKEPVVLSGGDLGFRVVGRRGDTAVGQWVVRLEGRWVATAPGASVVPVKK